MLEKAGTVYTFVKNAACQLGPNLCSHGLPMSMTWHQIFWEDPKSELFDSTLNTALITKWSKCSSSRIPLYMFTYASIGYDFFAGILVWGLFNDTSSSDANICFHIEDLNHELFSWALFLTPIATSLVICSMHLDYSCYLHQAANTAEMCCLRVLLIYSTSSPSKRWTPIWRRIQSESMSTFAVLIVTCEDAWKTSCAMYATHAGRLFLLRQRGPP